MINKSDINGSGSSTDKKGIAAAYRFGIGERNEFQASMYYLDNKNGTNQPLPQCSPPAANGWARPADNTSEQVKGTDLLKGQKADFRGSPRGRFCQPRRATLSSNSAFLKTRCLW